MLKVNAACRPEGAALPPERHPIFSTSHLAALQRSVMYGAVDQPFSQIEAGFKPGSFMVAICIPSR